MFVPAPPIRIDEFYKKYASQMRTAPEAAGEVARNSGGVAVFLDASRLWGTDASAKKAQRASDGIHNCQQGAAAFAAGSPGSSARRRASRPQPWTPGPSSWTGDDRYAKLKCDS